MKLSFAIQVRSPDLDYMRRELHAFPELMQKSMMLAVNAALKTGQSVIVKGIQKDTTITNKDRLFKDIVPKYATKGAPIASVKFNGRYIGALQYQHVATKDLGVAYRPSANGPLLHFAHGFEAAGINNNWHLFRRVVGSYYHVGSRAVWKPNIGRNMERIKPIAGPSIVTVMRRNPEIERLASVKASRTLHNRLLSQIDRSLKRKKVDRPDDAPEIYF